MQERAQPGLFSIFADVRPGERLLAGVMLSNLLIILVSYYVAKVVREPLILSTKGGAQWKSYSSALQAIVLMGYVPLYSWFSSKVDRIKLILGLNIFFLLCIEFFVFAIRTNVTNIGVFFFVWVGIFSLSVIAQFWSLANDYYTEDEGKRLFPLIAIGATVGSPIGSEIASMLFDSGMKPNVILQVSALLLICSMMLYWWSEKLRSRLNKSSDTPQSLKLTTKGGFSVILGSRYLLLIALLLLVLNVVNTTGEFILSSKVVAAASSATDKKAFIGSFYGNFFFYVNIVAFVVQAFFVSRIVKHFGIAGIVLLPALISLGAYSTIAVGAGLAVIRWMKIAENSSDYSIMNTTRAMLWLPTTREEKYKGKQTIDTFVVRFGDVISAGLVFAGTEWLKLSTSGFAIANLGFVFIWIGVAILLLKQHSKIERAARASGS